uniref:Uncharacterized protein n=1 Tax=Arundo donax TaxID=35708 RepID=A0A0A9C109_ARUDO
MFSTTKRGQFCLPAGSCRPIVLEKKLA